jgi:cation:H+ antiporter
VVVWSGAKLSRYGDMIAEKTGLGGTWVGLLLMACVTSLPELITGASAILIFDVPDIAAGDALGSCMFNLLVLAALDASTRTPFSALIHQGHVLAAALGILQLGTVVLALVAGRAAPMVGWVGLHSLMFLAIYLLAMRALFQFERTRLLSVAHQIAEETSYAHVSTRRAFALYGATAAVLVGVATLLPGLAEQIATQSGLSQSFVGSLFVACVTSLPEVVVSWSAARMGAHDMAAANLFGSNLFNVAILGIDDLLYVEGSLLAAVDTSQIATATAAMMMTAVAIVALIHRAARKRGRLAWDSGFLRQPRDLCHLCRVARGADVVDGVPSLRASEGERARRSPPV